MGGRAPRTFDSLEIRLRRGGLARRLGWLALTTCVLALVVHAFWALPSVLLVVATVGAPLALSIAALALSSIPRKTHGHATTEVATASEATTTIGRIAFGRSDVERAYLVAGPDSVHVEIVLRDGDVITIRTTLEQGRGILEATGLDPAHHALRLPLGGQGATVAVSALAAFGTLVLASAAIEGSASLGRGPVALGLAGLCIAFAATLRLGAYLAAPQNIVVGTDGVSLEPWSRQFIPWAALDGVSVHRRNLVLWLRRGESVRVFSSEMTGARAALVLGRVQAGIAQFRPGGQLARLDREGRSATDWLASLRSALVHEAGYRDAAVAREEVVRVLESGGARRDHRLAAAVALAAAGESERVRLVAESTADPSLREALLAAADPSLGPVQLERLLWA